METLLPATYGNAATRHLWKRCYPPQTTADDKIITLPWGRLAVAVAGRGGNDTAVRLLSGDSSRSRWAAAGHCGPLNDQGNF
jgi:hypothetical protein